MVLAFKKSTGTVCHAFEAFTRGCILLDLEMISFLPSWISLSFKKVFVLLSPFLKSGNKEQWHFAGPD